MYVVICLSLGKDFWSLSKHLFQARGIQWLFNVTRGRIQHLQIAWYASAQVKRY